MYSGININGWIYKKKKEKKEKIRELLDNFSSFLISQGYPSTLIPQVVAGVPSMHICLDFIPELLGQPQRKKQVSPNVFAAVYVFASSKGLNVAYTATI